MGSEETATRRLNLAQSFNPMGVRCSACSLAQQFILARLNPASRSISRHALDQGVLRQSPYLGIALVIAVVFVAIAITRMPASRRRGPVSRREAHPKATGPEQPTTWKGSSRSSSTCGAQIMCWTFIIHYGTMELGLTEVQAQGYNAWSRC